MTIHMGVTCANILSVRLANCFFRKAESNAKQL